MSEFNGVMMQYFHWYIEPNGNLWNELAENAADLTWENLTKKVQLEPNMVQKKSMSRHSKLPKKLVYAPMQM